MSQLLQYAREFMRSVKEALNRSYSWSGDYFTNVKVSWHPLQKAVLITVNYRLCCRKKLHLFILLYQIRRNDERGSIATLKGFANKQYAKKTTMAKTGPLPIFISTK